MRSTRYIVLMTIFALSHTLIQAQSYLIELTPKLFAITQDMGSGVSIDGNVILGKVVSIGGSFYQKLGDEESMMGINIKIGSNRQKLLSGYGIVRFVNARYDEIDMVDNGSGVSVPHVTHVSGLGATLGAGLSLRLGRSVSWIVEGNYFLGDDISDIQENGGYNYDRIGFRGLGLESGFAFRMFRKK